MKNPKLRIKLRHLAEEARIIRHEERRALKKARGIAERKPDSANGLRVLANDMRNHRIEVVRREARAAQLAQAFIDRKHPYWKVEQPRHKLDLAMRNKIASNVGNFTGKQSGYYSERLWAWFSLAKPQPGIEVAWPTENASNG